MAQLIALPVGDALLANSTVLGAAVMLVALCGLVALLLPAGGGRLQS